MEQMSSFNKKKGKTMLPKFSVKKPMTIFVGVIIVIALGIVSFTRMTPDLLPNINLPYAIVITAYPGASPEEVEEEITKPLEQALASLDNIEEITSTSSENMSRISLSFAENVNMDTLTSEIREKINGVSGSWDDMVSTPYIMKINPNVLPVTVTAMNKEGLSNVELTSFLDDELMTQLEGIEGVASVSASGNVEETIDVVLKQDKIDAVNNKIKAALDKEFGKAESEINEKSDELDDAIAETEQQKNELESQKNQLESAQDDLANQAARGQSQLIDKKVEIEAAKTQINMTITTLDENLKVLQSTKTELETVSASMAELSAQIASIDSMIGTLRTAQESYATLVLAQQQLALEIETLINSGAGEEEIALLQTQLDAVNAQIAGIEAQLLAYGITPAEIGAKIEELEYAKQQAQGALEQIRAAMQASGVDPDSISDSLAQVNAGIAEAQSARGQLAGTLNQLETGSVTVSEALAQLNKQQTSGVLQMSSALSQIIAGQTALSSASAQFDSAKAQIEEATKEFEDQKEAAYKAANVDVTMAMISTILTAQNFSMPAGYVDEADEQVLVRVGNKIDTVADLENLMLFDTGLESAGKVYLKDVADIQKKDNADEMYAKLDGQDGIILSFTKQSTYSTADVSNNIADRFEELTKKYDGLQFTNMSDQGDYIYIVVDSVLQNLILGAILAVIILIFFLKDIRPTLVIACSIPISLLVAIVLMYFSGVTLNVISLSGLAVGVGMLVDNSVVVIENIYRMRSEGSSAPKASVYGAVQVTGAIIASTLTTICVFLPIVFVEGITRQLFNDMALTIGYSLLASLFVAITLVPAMSSVTLRKAKPKEYKLFNKVLAGYEKVARLSLKQKWIVIGLSVILMVLSVYGSLQKGFIFMPSMSGKQLTVSIAVPEDTEFEAQTELLDIIAERIGDIEDIETVGAMISSSSGGMMSFVGGGGDLMAYAIIKDDAKRKDAEIAREIVAICEDLDAEVSAQGAMDMTSYMSSMGGSGVSMKLFGDDLDDLIAAAHDVSALLEDVEGIGNVESGVQDSTPEIRIVVDKNKAMQNGLTTAQVYQSINAAITKNQTATTMRVQDRAEDVIVYNQKSDVLNRDYLEDFIVNTQNMSTGEAIEVPLKEIAKFEDSESLNSISRENQKRMLTVSGEVQDGYNVSLVTTAAEKALADYSPKSGIKLESAGENETIMDAMEQLVYMMLLGVLVIYLIMVIQFQSLLSPFIVMFTIPLAFTGGFAALLFFGFEVSVVSMIGFVMLAGIIVNNGIVLVDYINQLRLEGMDKKEAIILSCKTRMRPVLMTTLTTVIGLLFMAAANGTGAELMQPIAIVCIGGLVYGTFMTLFLVPALYDIFGKRKMVKIDIGEDEISNKISTETVMQEVFDDISSGDELTEETNSEE